MIGPCVIVWYVHQPVTRITPFYTAACHLRLGVISSITFACSLWCFSINWVYSRQQQTEVQKAEARMEDKAIRNIQSLKDDEDKFNVKIWVVMDSSPTMWAQLSPIFTVFMTVIKTLTILPFFPGEQGSIHFSLITSLWSKWSWEWNPGSPSKLHGWVRIQSCLSQSSSNSLNSYTTLPFRCTYKKIKCFLSYQSFFPTFFVLVLKTDAKKKKKRVGKLFQG